MRISKTWGSHLPVLTRVVNETDGDILELGIGIYSTPYLDAICRRDGRKIESYDNNPKFFNRFEEYNSSFHKVILTNDWDSIPIEREWGVVFVDHAPNYRRGIETKRIANYAKYVVLHDSDPNNDPHYHYDEIYDIFKYSYDYKDLKPNTTVLSNFVDLTNFKI